MLEDSKQIVVVGAGIAGLTTALCLNHFGINACVYERSNEVTTAGAGIQLSPNANRVFSHIGLFDEISALSRRCKGVRVFDYKSNSQLALFDYMKFKRDAAFLFCHRAELVSILYAACKKLKIPVHFDKKLEKIKNGEVIFSDGNVYSADIIVGADGLHSNVRKAVIDEEKPIFTRQIAWRSIVPNSINQDDFSHVTLAPKRHLVSYPINDGSQLNLVLIKEQNEWQPDGWKHPEDPKVVKENFKDFSDEASKIIASIESVYKWGLFRYPMKKKWYNDRVILVGDAAHPTLPFLAQGAAMAIEDSFVIASKISKFPKLSFAFNEFQRERFPRVQRIISASAKNAQTFHLSNVISRLVLHFFLRLLTKFLPHLLVKRFDWIYDHNVTN
ncbi:FAD-dependent monooxygenase [Paracoccaceae bacterium]|nr:FAD-dependent monooxygenase [Paracoccaceae bacterium]